MQKLKGLPASPGIVRGPAYIFQETELKIEKKTVSDTSAELLRFEEATKIALDQIIALRAKANPRHLLKRQQSLMPMQCSSKTRL